MTTRFEFEGGDFRTEMLAKLIDDFYNEHF